MISISLQSKCRELIASVGRRLSWTDNAGVTHQLTASLQPNLRDEELSDQRGFGVVRSYSIFLPYDEVSGTLTQGDRLVKPGEVYIIKQLEAFVCGDTPLYLEGTAQLFEEDSP